METCPIFLKYFCVEISGRSLTIFGKRDLWGPQQKVSFLWAVREVFGGVYKDYRHFVCKDDL
jgi:hypothetical protein